MYAKIFTQIFNSSIADNWKHRHVFEDLLKLADRDGIVDMTQESISRQTKMPLKMVTEAITALCEPDERSRTRECEGRRLLPIDPNRGWGWKIVNYRKYREMRNEFDRTAYMREYMRERRNTPTQGDLLDSVKQKFNNGVNTPLTYASVSPSVQTPEGGTGETGAETEMDLPRGFPKTKEEAASHVGFIGQGCTAEFAMLTWSNAYGRGGRDSKDIPVRHWRGHLAAMWGFQQDRLARQKRGHPDARPEQPWSEIKRIEESIAKHPANRESTFHNVNATQAQKDDLRGKRARLKELKA